MESEREKSPLMHATTIVLVKKQGETVIAGDGQVSLGQTIIKAQRQKGAPARQGRCDRRLRRRARPTPSRSFERLESKLEQYPGQLTRACVELAKDWRMDRYLRRLEAMMLVADTNVGLVLTGSGDVLEPEAYEGGAVAAIGSGGNYALAAARALIDTQLEAEAIARRAMEIAAEICVYTNRNIVIESI